MIYLLGDKVRQSIIAEIINAKYFSLIIDSTPDISHVDQLSVVFRFVNCNGQVIERFVTFVPLESHKAESLTTTVLKLLEEYGIDIKNCREQCYDNATNMSGICILRLTNEITRTLSRGGICPMHGSLIEFSWKLCC